MQKDRLNQFKKDANRDAASVQKGLMKIYSNADGSLPDISHLEVRRRGRWKIYLFSVVSITILLAAATWLGFVIFNSTGNGTNQSIKLEITGQQSISSGDEVVYVMHYKNIDRVSLHNVEIIARYPDGFSFETSDPQSSNSFNTTWTIGDLAVNQSGQIEVKGKLIGEVGSIQTVSVTVSYQPENFSSAFKDSQSFNSQITSSIISLDIQGPDQILPQKAATYKITYQNNSDQDLSNVKIQLTYPSNFIFQQATPSPFQQSDQPNKLNNVWVVDKLAKQEKGEIDITGGFIADPQNTQPTIDAQIGFFSSDTNEFSLQQEKSITTTVTQPNLSLNLIVNGSNQDSPIVFGQQMTYSIVYKNLGQSDLTNVVITANIDSSILDWSTLSDKNNGKVDNGKITWSKDQVSVLSDIHPLAEGTITFTINTKNASQVNVNKDAMTVTSGASATIEKIGDLPATDATVQSQQIKNNINTDVSLKAQGRYFDDDNIAVGTGPLPPVVGQTTTFRIFWSVANSLHEINAVTVSATVPDGSNWNNKFLAKVGTINYNNKTRTVSWTIPKISPNKGFSDINAWFDVAVTPIKSQANSLLVLLNQSNLSATDSQTNSTISKTENAITSNLEEDPAASGKGLVIDISN